MFSSKAPSLALFPSGRLAAPGEARFWTSPRTAASGPLLAHLIADDTEHSHARFAFEQARRDSWQLVTTNAVIFETYALLVNRARNGRAFAIAFLDWGHLRH
jgi:hypothetical protein